MKKNSNFGAGIENGFKDNTHAENKNSLGTAKSTTPTMDGSNNLHETLPKRWTAEKIHHSIMCAIEREKLSKGFFKKEFIEAEEYDKLEKQLIETAKWNNYQRRERERLQEELSELKANSIRKEELERELEEEISYLKEHVIRANEGIKINVERVNSWIFQTERIKKMLLSLSEPKVK